MSIYTKFGDKGKTTLFAGKIVSKASLRVNTYGTLDELNSYLGVVLAKVKDKNLKKDLLVVQNDLFEIGAYLANPSKENNKTLEKHLEEQVINFEKEIDGLTKKLPLLRHFILPGGGESGASLHFARTLVRRAERRIVELSEKEKLSKEILIYMNRLSDLLFMYARFINKKQKIKEIIWNGGR
jgi:cob(I)alamin adenosyltransferase